MNRHTAGFLAIYLTLRPKWEYVADTLAEILWFLLLVIIGVIGFVPWFFVRIVMWAIKRLRKERKADGASQRSDSEVSGDHC